MATIGNYRITKLIGEGGFANIYQAEHVRLEELACLKQCKENTPDYTELLRQEAKILWKLSEHHSIPHSKDFLRAPDGSHVMVMSYIDGKTLDTFIPPGSRMHPEDASWITERLLSALFYCHYNGVVHSDIKPANVMVEPKKHDIKLIDFGLAVYRPNSLTRPIGYTPAFVAPELTEGKPPIPETDIYGAGMVMLYALGGDPATKTLPKDIAEPLKRFCESMIRYDPMERPNWDKLNLIDRLSDVRYEVFGRRNTDASRKTRIDRS
jgi:eukaryotic-like serine/threonine-protein kinase